MQGKLTEKLAVLATIDPATIASTETFTDVVDMGAATEVLAVASTGNMASETIDFKAYTCDSDGSNAAALSGRAATQLAAHATNNDNKQLVIGVRNTDLTAGGKQYVKFGFVTGGATGGPISVVVLGALRQGLASASDLSSVVEIVG